MTPLSTGASASSSPAMNLMILMTTPVKMTTPKSIYSPLSSETKYRCHHEIKEVWEKLLSLFANR